VHTPHSSAAFRSHTPAGSKPLRAGPKLPVSVTQRRDWRRARSAAQKGGAGRRVVRPVAYFPALTAGRGSSYREPADPYRRRCTISRRPPSAFSPQSSIQKIPSHSENAMIGEFWHDGLRAEHVTFVCWGYSLSSRRVEYQMFVWIRHPRRPPAGMTDAGSADRARGRDRCVKETKITEGSFSHGISTRARSSGRL
jgi:hypothetical protein